MLNWVSFSYLKRCEYKDEKNFGIYYVKIGNLAESVYISFGSKQPILWTVLCLKIIKSLYRTVFVAYRSATIVYAWFDSMRLLVIQKSKKADVPLWYNFRFICFLSSEWRPFSNLHVVFSFVRSESNLTLLPSLSQRSIFAGVFQYFSSVSKVSIYHLQFSVCMVTSVNCHFWVLIFIIIPTILVFSYPCICYMTFQENSWYIFPWLSDVHSFNFCLISLYADLTTICDNRQETFIIHVCFWSHWDIL